ncbi:glycosyltransferase family 4 protein [Paenibacillus sp. UNC499MF]|uniref:glycosyltransferase family 4 protein n=1 Tax=Paenibacillus sp. UNC499MF TaxID=1502751 RepID=UPI0008A02AE9|nr:glycosyltransferase [Paenibacillus sp. UNC499MF]SEG36522.1 Glycosyl transferases group 1 [Paenibacillus sp. UNC499MF]
MKLLFVFYIPSGGMETLNRQRVIALKKIGISCSLLYLHEGTGMQNLDGVPVYVTKDEKEITEIVNRERFEAVIISTVAELILPLRSSGYTGKIIYEAQGLGSVEEAVFILKRIAPLLLLHADAVLYPRTPHLMRIFETYYARMKKFSFHNCIDMESFRFESYPVAPVPIIGWVGRIEPNKNWRSLLEVGRLFRTRGRRVEIRMYVDNTLGSEEEEFRKLVADYRLWSCLTVVPNLPHQEMARQYSIIGDSGGVLLSTSRVEGFGYAVLEAMCCRCPVVSTDSDGVRSFIADRVTGRFYPHDDHEEAFRQISELMDNVPLREEIRFRACRHAAEQFSPGLYAAQFSHMLGMLGIGLMKQHV